jgi:DNA-binding FadR family transcriptional regulator
VEKALSTPDHANVSPLRALKTAEIVAGDLRRQIVRGDIAEGDALPGESELMAKYGVARSSLREALRVLESEGLIVVRRGVYGGARATRPSITVAANFVSVLMQMHGVTLADIFDARAWIEPAAAGLLAGQRHRTGPIRQLTAILDRERAVLDDHEAYIQAVISFHEQLIELSGNRTLSLLWQTLHEVIAVEFEDFVRPGSSSRAVEKRQENCRELLRLIGEGDSEIVEEFWRERLMAVRKYVVDRHGEKTIVDAL